MAQPPLRITGALCVLVTCALIGIIIRNSLGDAPLALTPEASEVSTTPTPSVDSGAKGGGDRSSHPVPETDYAEDSEAEVGVESPASPDTGGGERVEGRDGRSGGETTLRVAKEGYALRAPKQVKPKVGQEGPTHYLTLSLDNQSEFLSIVTRTIYPWTDFDDLLSRYEPYTEGERVQTQAGLDVPTGGNPWSMPDERTIVIKREERLHVIRSAGFGKDFPEQIALINGFSILELPSHTERLKARYKLTDEQLAGPPTDALKAKLEELAERLGNLRGGLPTPVRRALEYYRGGEFDQRGGLLLAEFLQVVADYVAKSMRKH